VPRAFVGEGGELEEAEPTEEGAAPVVPPPAFE
jgi:hypothetical protein